MSLIFCTLSVTSPRLPRKRSAAMTARLMSEGMCMSLGGAGVVSLARLESDISRFSLVCLLSAPLPHRADKFRIGGDVPGGRGPAAYSKHGARCYQHKHALQANNSRQSAGTVGKASKVVSRCPAALDFTRKPLACTYVVHVAAVEQGNEDIHVQQRTHQIPSASRRRSMSSFVTMTSCAGKGSKPGTAGVCRTTVCGAAAPIRVWRTSWEMTLPTLVCCWRAISLAAARTSLFLMQRIRTVARNSPLARPDHTGAWRGAACSCRPNARVTLRMVAKLGLPSPERALYRLSRPRPVSLASWVMPLARAISPSAFAIKAASSPASSRQASR
ncbi:hypothetical protein ebA5853 [Aromatoleum aromaticum EbN1]|uniref:Uncharacterized protein n=1 Tax=Aromatoleum aromaticum (strain DSM 19018 / LMG 30748 / EbN1) TaxID=76114 RepID=Q5NZR2_AROAE|nr:hypothetical protein ebA5853 [Aromatoleum aromaticum EbN1]